MHTLRSLPIESKELNMCMISSYFTCDAVFGRVYFPVMGRMGYRDECVKGSVVQYCSVEFSIGGYVCMQKKCSCNAQRDEMAT